jgi:hypothetical protein
MFFEAAAAREAADADAKNCLLVKFFRFLSIFKPFHLALSPKLIIDLRLHYNPPAGALSGEKAP